MRTSVIAAVGLVLCLCDTSLIFQSAGYCFRTPRAIRAFGNAGCQYDDEADVPLSARQRAEVAEIKAMERDIGCR